MRHAAPWVTFSLTDASGLGTSDRFCQVKGICQEALLTGWGLCSFLERLLIPSLLTSENNRNTLTADANSASYPRRERTICSSLCYVGYGVNECGLQWRGMSKTCTSGPAIR